MPYPTNQTVDQVDCPVYRQAMRRQDAWRPPVHPEMAATHPALPTQHRQAPAPVVVRTRNQLFLEGRDMKFLTRLVPEATLLAGSRPASRAKLEAIDELLGLVFTPTGIVHFLTTPAGVFGGETALALILRGDYDQVLSELAADYNGDGA